MVPLLFGEWSVIQGWDTGAFWKRNLIPINCKLVQPWWLGGRASYSHSVESRSLLPRWIESRLGRFYELILTKNELMLPEVPWTVICTYYVQIHTIDNQLPVILLAIRLRSLDLKHLIPSNGLPEIQG